ncbi:MAG: twin-arginine translocase TatA/TatE family subunit [Actinomycetes bacterium]
MFGVSGWDLIVLGIVAMVLVGPERLPKVAAEAANWVRRLRDLADKAKSDLAATVGPEAATFVEDLRGLADLHPRNIIANALAEPTVKPVSPAAGPTSVVEPGPVGFDPDAT